MKSLIALALVAVPMLIDVAPAAADTIAPAATTAGTDLLPGWQTAAPEFDRRGRRPRVPGGSGCDSPRDRIEHPECAV